MPFKVIDPKEISPEIVDITNKVNKLILESSKDVGLFVLIVNYPTDTSAIAASSCPGCLAELIFSKAVQGIITHVPDKHMIIPEPHKTVQ